MIRHKFLFTCMVISGTFALFAGAFDLGREGWNGSAVFTASVGIGMLVWTTLDKWDSR